MKSSLISLLFISSLWSKDIVENSFILLTTKTNGYMYVCSGVAVAPKKILTAAHCLDDAVAITVVREKSLRYGNTFLDVMEFEQHPDYNKSYSNFLYDIGLLFLDEEIIPKEKIISIRELDSTKEVYRVGFGRRQGTNVMNLFKLTPPIFDYQSYFYLFDNQSYSGDSGGPIFQKIDNEYYLVGIHSTLEGTDKTYNVSTDYFYEWFMGLEL